MSKRYEYISNGKTKLQESIDNANEHLSSKKGQKEVNESLKSVNKIIKELNIIYPIDRIY